MARMNKKINTLKRQNAYNSSINQHKKLIQNNITTLKSETDNYNNSINVDNRTAYYEYEATQQESWWYNSIQFIYAAIWIGTVIFLCITIDHATKKPKILSESNIVMLILLLIYPFVIYPLSNQLYQLIHQGTNYVTKQLPTDIYLKV